MYVHWYANTYMLYGVLSVTYAHIRTYVQFHIYVHTHVGVAPGGEVKLIKSASADVCDPNVRSVGVSSIMRVHCMTFHPRDINHYYVGTDMVSCRSRVSHVNEHMYVHVYSDSW